MVSVIIPVYNVEQYLRDCLESILSQTYKDIEIIIINDGSTDKSGEIIASYLEKYKNIFYLNQENKGVAEARNLGLKNAKGEYVLFVDSDDYLDKNMIKKMYDNANKYDSDVVISGHIRFDETNSYKNVIKNYDEYENGVYNGNQLLNMMLNIKVKGHLWDKLFKRSDLIKNNFSLESNRYIEDWFPVIKQISQSRIITFVNEPLYYYRQRNESAMHKINKKLLDDYIYTVSKINNYLNDYKFQYNKECKNVFDCETFYSVVRYFYLNNCVINKLKKQRDIYKMFNQSDYCKYVKFSYSFFVNKKINIKLKLKVLLWKLKIFHLFMKDK